jgi:hypothetical protein
MSALGQKRTWRTKDDLAYGLWLESERPIQCPRSLPNVGSVAINQNLFSILAGTTAFRTRQANKLAGVFVQLKRANHVMEDFGTNIGCLVLLPLTIRESNVDALGNQSSNRPHWGACSADANDRQR